MAAVVGLLLRAVLALAGLVFFLSALVAGVIATVVLTLWALLSGRRPRIVRFGPGRAPWRSHHEPPPPPPQARAGEVIDVEVRELPRDETRRD